MQSSLSSYSPSFFFFFSLPIKRYLFSTGGLSMYKYIWPEETNKQCVCVCFVWWWYSRYVLYAHCAHARAEFRKYNDGRCPRSSNHKMYCKTPINTVHTCMDSKLKNAFTWGQYLMDHVRCLFESLSMRSQQLHRRLSRKRKQKITAAER